MGAALALVGLVGAGVSVAIVGYHGVALTILAASVGGSLFTFAVALAADIVRTRTPGSERRPAFPLPEDAGPTKVELEGTGRA